MWFRNFSVHWRFKVGYESFDFMGGPIWTSNVHPELSQFYESSKKELSLPILWEVQVRCHMLVRNLSIPRMLQFGHEPPVSMEEPIQCKLLVRNLPITRRFKVRHEPPNFNGGSSSMTTARNLFQIKQGKSMIQSMSSGSGCKRETKRSKGPPFQTVRLRETWHGQNTKLHVKNNR